MSSNGRDYKPNNFMRNQNEKDGQLCERAFLALSEHTEVVKDSQDSSNNCPITSACTEKVESSGNNSERADSVGNRLFLVTTLPNPLLSLFFLLPVWDYNAALSSLFLLSFCCFWFDPPPPTPPPPFFFSQHVHFYVLAGHKDGSSRNTPGFVQTKSERNESSMQGGEELKVFHQQSSFLRLSLLFQMYISLYFFFQTGP